MYLMAPQADAPTHATVTIYYHLAVQWDRVAHNVYII